MRYISFRLTVVYTQQHCLPWVTFNQLNGIVSKPSFNKVLLNRGDYPNNGENIVTNNRPTWDVRARRPSLRWHRAVNYS